MKKLTLFALSLLVVLVTTMSFSRPVMAGYERTLVPDFMSTRPPGSSIISYKQTLEITKVKGFFEADGVVFVSLDIKTRNCSGFERISTIDAVCDSGASHPIVLNENAIKMLKFNTFSTKTSVKDFNGERVGLEVAPVEVTINGKRKPLDILVNLRSGHSMIGAKLLGEIGYFKYMTEKEVVKN